MDKFYYNLWPWISDIKNTCTGLRTVLKLKKRKNLGSLFLIKHTQTDWTPDNLPLPVLPLKFSPPLYKSSAPT